MSVKSVTAILGGIVVIWVLSQVLEFPLVQAFAAAPIEDLDGYYAARNQPPMQVALVVIAGITGLLAGYLVAKIAGEYELQHAAVAAAVQAASLVYGYAAEDPAVAPAGWVRVAVVVVTVGAMLLGATVRARAARPAPAKEVEP